MSDFHKVTVTEDISATVRITKTYDLNNVELTEFKLMTNAERDEYLQQQEALTESDEVLDLQETVGLSFTVTTEQEL